MAGTKEIAQKNGMLGGRPRGSKHRITILKEKMRDRYEKYIATISHKIVNSQTNLALGTYKMFSISFDENGKKVLTTVNDENKIEDLIMHGEAGKDYIVVEGSKGDWKAGNALLDRAFGKASETLKVNGEVKFSLKTLAMQAREISADVVEQESADVEQLSSLID